MELTAFIASIALVSAIDPPSSVGERTGLAIVYYGSAAGAPAFAELLAGVMATIERRTNLDPVAIGCSGRRLRPGNAAPAIVGAQVPRASFRSGSP